MPLTKDLNHTRAEIMGVSKLFLSLNVATRDAAITQGFAEFGGLKSFEIKSEAKTDPVLKPVNGVMRQVDELAGLITLGYDLVSTEIADARKLLYYLSAAIGQDLTQAAADTSDGDGLTFTGDAPAELNRWYDILKTGVRVRALTAVAVKIGDITLVEGVDYILDTRLGLIRFIKDSSLPADAVTMKVSAPAIDASSDAFMRGLIPLQDAVWRGYARLVVLDKNRSNPVVLEHNDFSFTLTVSKNFGVVHDKLSEASIKLMVTSDEGTIFHRD